MRRLQFFLSEPAWDQETVNTGRLKPLRADSTIAPQAGGVLVVDDSGHRKDGAVTTHVGKQCLGSVGKSATPCQCSPGRTRAMPTGVRGGARGQASPVTAAPSIALPDRTHRSGCS
ncbi:transposase [Streptomyces sp. cg2]|uniref:transposase n=1 Tax=Streptomyces sp. cg2 TaxID=3238799 RepID=UPI0034E21630